MQEICPILSLAIYVSVFPFHGVTQQFFPGVAQYDRYRKIMKEFYQLPDVHELLVEFGIDPNDLGTHSTRKGSVTYCTSGTTSAPATSAVHLRAGWTLPGVTGTYMKYEVAGDLLCVAPSFFSSSGEQVERTVRIVFPSLPPSINRADIFVSLLWCIIETFSRTIYSKNILWRSPIMFSDLAERVSCRLHQPGDPFLRLESLLMSASW